MMRFFITGSAGFIGFHLTRALLAKGHHVTGYDAMTSYYDPSLKERRHQQLARFPNYRLVRAYLEDGPSLREAITRAEPTVIIHLAAQAGVRYSIESPDTYVSSNLTGSAELLEICRTVRPVHLLLASTSSIYGANPVVPFSESHPADQPLSLYAATKKGMEAMAHSYAHLFGIPTTIFRFFTVYGPWGRPDMALFKFVKAISEGEPIDVYGNGQMQRDFTYVDDLVEAISRLIPIAPSEANRVNDALARDTLSPQGPYRVVNIGGGKPVELMTFIRTVEQCMGRRATLNLMGMQAGDVPRTWADPSLLQALTGFLPEIPPEVGVRAFVDWFREDQETNDRAAGRKPILRQARG